MTSEVNDTNATFVYQAEVDRELSDSAKQSVYGMHRRRFLSELVNHLEEMRTPVMIDYEFSIEPPRQMFRGELLVWRCRLTAIQRMSSPMLPPRMVYDTVYPIVPEKSLARRLRRAIEYVVKGPKVIL